MQNSFWIDTELVDIYGYASSMQGGRSENQDDLGFLNTPLGLLVVVCDGMGGGPGGKTASGIVLREIASAISSCNSLTPPEQALRDAFCKAQEALMEKMNAVPSLKGMGSTAVVLLISKECAYVAHAGDSRFYQIKKGRQIWRTTDHSLVSELVQMNTLTEEQARTSPQSNVITRGLGATKNHTPDVMQITYSAMDRFVLCTDGVWGIMPAENLLMKLSQEKDVKTVVDALQDEVDTIGNSHGGGHDNHTLIMIDIKHDSEKKMKMEKKYNRIILGQAFLSLVLLISLIFCLVGADTKKEAAVLPNGQDNSELQSYKERYQALINSSDEATKKALIENMQLQDTIAKLRAVIENLQMELDQIRAGQQVAYTGQDVAPANSVQDSIIIEFGNIINCKVQANGQKFTVATQKVKASYDRILSLLDKYMNNVSDDKKAKLKGIKRKIINNRDKFNVSQEGNYFVLTGVAQKFAQDLKSEFSSIK